MEYLYLQDGFYDSEDPREIQRFLNTVENGGYEPAKCDSVTVVALSPLDDDELPC
jgi:hypothetical protein